MTGKISAFDDHRGIGTVTADDGRDYPFHCTQIADGTRTIKIGTAVTFDAQAGHLGRFEATVITPA
jgi:CspA family cold shock protein